MISKEQAYSEATIRIPAVYYKAMEIYGKEAWEAGCKQLLTNISKTFLDPANQDKADNESEGTETLCFHFQ